YLEEDRRSAALRAVPNHCLCARSFVRLTMDARSSRSALGLKVKLGAKRLRRRRAWPGSGLDDGGYRREEGGVAAGHAVHCQHAGDDGGGDVLFDRRLGEGIPYRRRLAVAVAAPLDLRHLDRRIAQIVGDERAWRGAARQLAFVQRDRFRRGEGDDVEAPALEVDAGRL